jgi:hypothetical protein
MPRNHLGIPLFAYVESLHKRLFCLQVVCFVLHAIIENGEVVHVEEQVEVRSFVETGVLFASLKPYLVLPAH